MDSAADGQKAACQILKDIFSGIFMVPVETGRRLNCFSGQIIWAHATHTSENSHLPYKNFNALAVRISR